MNYYNLRRFAATILSAAVALAVAASCTTADDSLGFDFVPDNQKMKIRRTVLDPSTAAGRRMVTTKLFRTDSIVSSNLTYGYIGAQSDADFGKRSAGFLSQYLVVGLSDSTGFGYRPIFDSVQLVLSVSDYKGDTTKPIRFNVYEVVGDLFEGNDGNGDGATDTLFYPGFRPMEKAGLLASEPVFTFVFPDGKSTGPATTAVTMTATAAGRKLIDRLMLVDGEYKDNDMTVYRDDDLWVDCFKGLCILPEGQPEGEGAMFSLDLSASGFAIYGRNRREDDPEFIRDTTQAFYYFYDSAAKTGNVSVNSIERDYAGTLLDESMMREADANKGETDNRPEVEIGYVDGMAGPVTEITFGEEFFLALDALRTVDEDGEPVEHSDIAFNQVRMLIYLDGAEYDWELNSPEVLTPLLDKSMSRLGLYTDYKKLTAVPDYNYVYESQYSMNLNYDGYLTRSFGCYTLDITAYVQGLWRSYRALGEDETVEDIAARKVYLGPEAYGVYGFGHSIVQGMDGGTNRAPIKFELTYTLIK